VILYPHAKVLLFTTSGLGVDRGRKFAPLQDK